MNYLSRARPRPPARDGLGVAGVRPRRILSRARRYGLWILTDAAIVTLAFSTALVWRFDSGVPASLVSRLPSVALGLSALFVMNNALLSIYSRAWRYASVHDALVLVESIVLSSAIVLALDAAWMVGPDHPVPLSVVPVGGLLVLVAMGLVRFRARIYAELARAFAAAGEVPVLIVGAGSAGHWMARELLSSPRLGYRPVCFVDDDPAKQGQRLFGLRVAGTRHQVPELVRRHRIQVIALAIPTLSDEERREILQVCQSTNARVKIMPSLGELLTAPAPPGLLRDVRLEDLLGRAPVSFGARAFHPALRGVVLITGAAGSIGSQLASEIVAAKPERLILLDTNESGLYDLHAELTQALQDDCPPVTTIVADVSRAGRLRAVFDEYQPTVVFHAAAYKHVPMMERFPDEAVLANVQGTLNICCEAQRSGCQRVVFISTDKAVAPSNVMGATKRIGELLIQAFAAQEPRATVFCAVRFGNVLGSRGSVIPTFDRQIRRGGPVTLTHREVTRYFMTIPEAASLIVEAACWAEGGEIFLLDMGAPVSILDLARKMIYLYGLRPDEDIQITEVGLRPGEKLHEVLVSDSESTVTTEHPRIARLVQTHRPAPDLEDLVQACEELSRLALSGTRSELLRSLFAIAGGSVPVASPTPLETAALDTTALDTTPLDPLVVSPLPVDRVFARNGDQGPHLSIDGVHP